MTPFSAREWGLLLLLFVKGDKTVKMKTNHIGGMLLCVFIWTLFLLTVFFLLRLVSASPSSSNKLFKTEKVILDLV